MNRMLPRSTTSHCLYEMADCSQPLPSALMDRKTAQRGLGLGKVDNLYSDAHEDLIPRTQLGVETMKAPSSLKRCNTLEHPVDSEHDVVEIAQEAVTFTRNKLGTPVNLVNPLRAFSQRYRNESAQWLLLRAQRSNDCAERSALCDIYHSIKHEGIQEKQTMLNQLNKLPQFDHFNEKNSSLWSYKEIKQITHQINEYIDTPYLSTAKKYEKINDIYDNYLEKQLTRIGDFEQGNCSEFALQTAARLTSNQQKNVLVLSLYNSDDHKSIFGQFNHSIVIMGVEDHEHAIKDNSLGRRKEWGDDFLIVDAWSDDVYRFDELQKRSLCNGLSPLKNITRNSVRGYLESGIIKVVYAKMALPD